MGVWYSVFVRSFADGNADGVGDLKGLILKLDYFSELNVEGLWLLPISTSPSYHKYDVVDYKNVDIEYGTLKDFDFLIKEAHSRNIKIIIDLVLNHTSINHHYFVAACKSKKNPYRNYYVWKKKEEIPDSEKKLWYAPDAGPQDEYYYGLFWKGMPDLNYDHPAVRKAALDVASFWLKRGVDGFRLDAAMHIFPPGREKDNYLWWQEFRAHVDSVKPGSFIVGEITESCNYIAPYLQNGLKSAFNFELADRIIHAVADEKQEGFIQRVSEIISLYRKTDSRSYDCTFISNHDQDRFASRLNGDSRKVKLAASILLTLPGIPFLYYGEELGMLGVKPDEHIREPFLWDDDIHDASRCKWISNNFSNESSVDPLNEQKEDPASIYHHYKTLIELRNQSEFLDKGEIDFIHCDDPSVLLFSRSYDGNSLVVFHNLSGDPVVLQNEDEPHHQFDLIYESHPDCDVNEQQFKIAPYATMILKSKTGIL